MAEKMELLYILQRELELELEIKFYCTQHQVGDASRSSLSHWLLWVSAQYSIDVPFTLKDVKS